MHLMNKEIILVAVTMMATPGLGAPPISLDWTFEATYVLESDGDLTYSESGVFKGALLCEEDWVIEAEPPESTLYLGERIIVTVDAVNGVIRQAVESGFERTVEQAICLGSLQATPFEEVCNHTSVWGPAVSPEPVTELQEGWQVLTESVVSSTAIGVFGVDHIDEHRRDLPLPFRYAAPRYELGDVPFTGRVEYMDEATGDWSRSRDYIAGQCWSDYESGTCNPVCFYGVEEHGLLFRARPTSGDPSGGSPIPSAPVPMGPLGDWTEYLIVCNDGCSGDMDS